MKKAAKKRATEEVRKQDLIIGTLNSIVKYGYLNSTINTISEESGFSRGLINHYFDSKEDLLTAAHRYYLQNGDDYYRHLVSSVKTGNFDLLYFAACGSFVHARGYEQVHIHYCSAAYMVPEIMALHRELWGKYRAFLGRRLAKVADEKGIKIDVRLAAIELTQLADGLWKGLVMEEAYSAEDCCIIIRKWLCDLFGEKPEDHPLMPDFDVNDFPTSAPLPLKGFIQ